MNNIGMKRPIITLCACVMLIVGGCRCVSTPTTPPTNPPPQPPPVEIIATKDLAPTYFSIYTNSTDISHIKLSSMFKYYLEFAREGDETWPSITSNLYVYVAQTTNQYVHFNYPKKLTANEAMFFLNLGNSSIASIEKGSLYPMWYAPTMEEVLISLTRMMNEHEYDRNTE